MPRKKKEDGVLVLFPVAAVVTAWQKQLRGDGFISAHGSRFHFKVVGKLKQQGVEAAGHAYGQEQRKGTCMLVLCLPFPLSSGAGTRPTGWCRPR